MSYLPHGRWQKVIVHYRYKPSRDSRQVGLRMFTYYTNEATQDAEQITSMIRCRDATRRKPVLLAIKEQVRSPR